MQAYLTSSVLPGEDREAPTCQRMDPLRVKAFALRHFQAPANGVQIRMRPLRGGLEAAGVFRVRAVFTNQRKEEFVVKWLTGDNRELAAYTALLGAMPSVAPRLLGSEKAEDGTSYIYLEWVNSWQPWPWRDTRFAALVLEQLARIHSSLPVAKFVPPHLLASWDYERELLESARFTLELFESVRGREELGRLRLALPALRRLVTALPAIRRRLLMAERQRVVLHGDAHPGNAIIRARAGSKEAVLLDWGRTRLGSPLEDVSSWLQSLGYWEPEARRRHDTLLRRYLAVRGLSTDLARDLRDLYWLAGASNGLAGAIAYYLSVLTDADRPPEASERASGPLRDWLRVVRRADMVWRG